MGGRSLGIVLFAVLLLGGLGLVLLSSGDGSSGPPPAVEIAPKPVPTESDAPAEPLGARLLRRTQLRTSPGGRVVATIGTRTEFKSKRVLAVVERRKGWIGVLSEKMPNSVAGWIPSSAAELRHEPYALEVDLSKRRVTVRREGRVLRILRVVVGRPGTETPTGRFGVTDTLRIGRGANAYGCCAIAFTARQADVPQGWTGGDRVAIHGTGDVAAIGTAASAGCLRAINDDMRWLMKRVRLGAPVVIHA